MKLELYDVFEEKEFIKLIKENFNTDFNPKKEKLVFIDEEPSLYGDFYLIENYAFKKCFGGYQCLVTPNEKHTALFQNGIKASGDRSKAYFTRYRSKLGGKEEFNPVTKSGGREDINVTKARINR